MTLTEFLLARIAEDEEVAQEAPALERESDGSALEVASDLDYGPIAIGASRARVLAQCAAMRKIVEQWQVGAERLDERGRPAHLFDPLASALLKSHAGWLRILASVYRDHPDFDPEWRP